MTKEQSLELTSEIASVIAQQAPYVDYSIKELKKARQSMGEAQLEHYRGMGLWQEDFELFYVVKRFADSLHLFERADEAYLQKLFQSARKYSVADFHQNPYMREIQAPDVRIGEYLLTNASYDRGEIFQYDMPDLREELIVPKLGFFTGKVRFPSIYEGNIPWMSVCPSEIASMEKAVGRAHGKVLVLGLGLGYYPLMISHRQEVEAITIVEIQPEIIQIFEEYLLPQFEEKEKIRVIRADACAYLERVKPGDYDYCFADIWENQIDGAESVKKIKPFEKRLPGTEFAYWIEEAILWQIENEEIET